MAACDSFQRIFDKPLPDNPTLIEALSQWNRNQILKARKPIDLSSFSEIFGELHFHEKNNSFDSSSSPHSPFSLQFLLNQDKDDNADEKEKEKDNPSPSPSPSPSSSSSSSSSTWSSSSSSLGAVEGFSSKSLESLQLCTEGLGSESSDDVEDSIPNISNKEGYAFEDRNTNEEEEEEEEEDEEMVKSNLTSHSLASLLDRNCSNHLSRESYSSRSVSRTTAFTNSGSVSGTPSSFPPPISCIGRSGKPWVCFRSYRRDGRFVLKEVRIPTQEFLTACREDGRLRLHFVQPDEEIPEEEEEEKEEEEDEEEDNIVDEEDEVVADEKGETED